MDISNLKRDTARIEAGEWIDEIPLLPDVRFKVRGIGSRVYRVRLDRLARAVPRNGRQSDGSLKIDVAARITGEAMAEEILLDWEGLTDNGKPLPYSKERALALLTNPDFEDFANAVSYAAAVVQNGRESVAEQTEGN